MRIDNRWKRLFTRLMQLSLLSMLLTGIYISNSKVALNSGIGLLISLLPGFLERDYSVPVSPFLSLWITSAVFFHALGSSGFYQSVWWWDHLTHSLSASIVAATGYTAVRSIDLHSENVRLPDRFMFVFILMTVAAFGVLWELFEFGLDIIATSKGISMPLAQHGLSDTMKDMTFNLGGAVIAAVLGQAYLSELAEEIREKLE